ncbi:MAG: hypothetical protein GY792_30435, partial [Gammaproteobacteria bacterium]|nr:hypothetical protein [Gammaproteobacteria bacterium]
RLMIGAASVGLSANEPRTPTDTRRLKPFVARCSVEELKPLRNEAAAELLWSVLEREAMERPKKVEKKLIREAQGNPKAIVDLARRIQRGDAAELRRIQTPVRRMNIGWIVLVAIVAAALVSRRIVDSYVALGIVTALALVLRPLIGRMMFSGDDD